MDQEHDTRPPMAAQTEMPVRDEWGVRLEQIRYAHGRAIGLPDLSQAKFAKILGIKAATYRRYERSETYPSMATLKVMRLATGISMDWFVADLPVGVNPNSRQPNIISTGYRLRWARETQEPWLASCAAVMTVSAALWERFETGAEPLPHSIAVEFAHRFSVTTEYLFWGKMAGVALPVRQMLEAAHPELRDGEPASHTNMATRDGNMSREGYATPAHVRG